MMAIYFILGFLLGIFIALVLVLTVPALGEVIFNKFFSSVKEELVARSKKIIEEREEEEKQSVKNHLDNKKTEISTVMKTLVADKTEEIEKALKDLNEKLQATNATWKKGNAGSIESLDKFREIFTQWTTNLTNPTKQGQESELALSALLTAIGFVEGHTFLEQQKKENEDGETFKPDFYVKTKKKRWFVIDSKSPLKEFANMVESNDDEAKKRHLERLCENFKSHIKTLGKKKYAELDNKTVPFTIMFVPNSAMYLTVMNEIESDILELSRKNNVFVSPPAMLIPILHMFNEGLLEEEFESKKDVFRELIEKLIQAIGFLDTHFIEAEKGIAKAQDSMEQFRKSWNKYLPGRSRNLIKDQNLNVEEVKELSDSSEETKDVN